jgi:hypothetical protein
MPTDDDPLRLGLHGFDADEAGAIRAMIDAAAAAWTTTERTPLDALLLARGTRVDDPEQVAVLRVSLDPQRVRDENGERRLAPLMLRRPIRAAAMRVALAAARSRIERYRPVPTAARKKAA